MTLILDRMAIEEAGGNPEKLAGAVLAQIAGAKLPMPVEDIAQAVGIQSIESRPLDGFEACLLTDGNKRSGAIIINARSSRERRRYSIGHELGHFLNAWHFADDAISCASSDMTASDEKTVNREAEANRFAAALLTPRLLVRPYLRSDPDLAQALALASAAAVSKQAAIRRYVDLHEVPAAAIFARDGRILYVHTAKAFPKLKLWNRDLLPAEVAKSPLGVGKVTEIEDADPDDWLCRSNGDLRLQTLNQADSYQIILLSSGE